MRYRAASIVVSVLAFSLPLSPPAALAQDDADPGDAKLLDTLREFGLNELIEHHVSGKQLGAVDEVLADLARMEQDAQAAQNQAKFARQLALLDQMLNLRLRLLDENPDDPRAAFWAVDLANPLFLQYLPSADRHAILFYEFGLPTAGQRQTVEKWVPAIYADLREAEQNFFMLRGQLARDDKMRQQLDREGLIDKMPQYRSWFVPFYLAQAAYYTALMPDDHPLWQELGQNPLLPAAENVQQARELLLNQAVAYGKEFLQNFNKPGHPLQDLVISLIGAAEARRGDADAIRNRLQPAAAKQTADAFNLSAHLRLAMAKAQAGQEDAAVAELEQIIKTHPLITKQIGPRNWFWDILVRDAQNKALMMKAERLRAAGKADEADLALAASFDVFDPLFNDPKAPGWMSNYLIQRWMNLAGVDADPVKLPAQVVLAVGQSKRGEGDRLIKAGNVELGKKVLKDGIAYLKLFADPQWREEKKVTTPLAVRGLYNLAASMFILDSEDPGNVSKVVQILTTVAEKGKEDPLGASAASFAEGQAFQLMKAEYPGGREQYKAAAELLIEHYADDVEDADAAKMRYATSILEPDGEFAEAQELYRSIPRDSPEYFAARNLIIEAAVKELDQLRDAGQDRALGEKRAQTDRDIDDLIEVASQAMADPQHPRRRNAAETVASVLLVRANMALDSDQPERAVAALDELERRILNADLDYMDGEFMRLVRSASASNRVLALLDAGRLDEAAERVLVLMAEEPANAAGLADRVMRALFDEIDALRREASRLTGAAAEQVRGEAEARARIAKRLAADILKWAEDPANGVTPNEQVWYRLKVAEAASVAGEYDEALAQIDRVLRALPRDPAVLTAQADTVFAKAEATNDAQLFRQARGLYKTLVEGLQSPPANHPDPANFRPPNELWNAWVGYLEASARARGAGVTIDVPREVDKLLNRYTRPLERARPGDKIPPKYRQELLNLKSQYPSGSAAAPAPVGRPVTAGVSVGAGLPAAEAGSFSPVQWLAIGGAATAGLAMVIVLTIRSKPRQVSVRAQARRRSP